VALASTNVALPVADIVWYLVILIQTWATIVTDVAWPHLQVADQQAVLVIAKAAAV
jgi:hypothetical protein